MDNPKAKDYRDAIKGAEDDLLDAIDSEIGSAIKNIHEREIPEYLVGPLNELIETAQREINEARMNLKAARAIIDNYLIILEDKPGDW